MNLLIVYGSAEGQTRKICEFLREEAGKANHMAEVHNAAEDAPAPNGYDAVVIGASLHAGKFQAAVGHYAERYHQELNAIPTVFLTVSLTAAGNDSASWEELRKITQDFLNQTGWKPEYVEQVAGALRYSKYNFLKKFIMRMIASKAGGSTDTSRDYEYTDWNQVKSVIVKLEQSMNKAGRTTDLEHS